LGPFILFGLVCGSYAISFLVVLDLFYLGVLRITVDDDDPNWQNSNGFLSVYKVVSFLLPVESLLASDSLKNIKPN
jgi:hypothetical protein